MTKRLNVSDALERLKQAAVDFADTGAAGEIRLVKAALQFASAKKRRQDSRDAWKIKHRLG